MLREFLMGAGYIVMGARNGLEAFRLMDAHRPDLVLLDIEMPVMDGWQFRTLQMRDPKHADIPVIALSGVFDTLDVARKLGTRCLPKPLELGALLKEVRQACGP